MPEALVVGALVSGLANVVLDRLISSEFVNLVVGKKLDRKLVDRLKTAILAAKALAANAEQKQFGNELIREYFLAEIEGPEQKSDSETEKDCRCCWILTSLHSKWIFWSYRSPIGALSTALESRHPGLSSNI
ncbi:hypothetical protein AHAS_Ahas12G0048000 [Arachis hypogaea]